ncbi:MAG: ABC transporter substrate-binding protein [Jatrophihabitantaceae bacterium]
MNQLNVPLSRRGFMGAAGAVGGALALAACGGKSTPPGAAGGPTASGAGTAYNGPNVNLAFWNGWTGADGDYAKKMVTQFNSETKNIKVNMNVFQWADFYQKMPAAVTSGNGPDIAVMHIDAMPTQAAQRVIVPIDAVANSLKLNESDYAEAVWKGGMYQDKRYGIPIDVHCLGLFYNKDVFEKAGLDPEKPPTNKDEYIAALDAMKSKGIQGSWVSPFQFTGGLMYQSLLWQFGGELFNEDVTKATWDSEGGIAALTFMTDLVKNGYSPKNVGQDADYVALKNGRNALNWQGIWQVNEVTKLTTAKIGLAELPKIGDKGGVWGNSHQFVLPRSQGSDDNKVNAAAYFVNWFTQNSAEWAKSGKVPAEEKLAESSEFTSIEGLQPFAKEVPDVHFPPAVAGIGDALTAMYDAVNAAVLGKSDPGSALRSAANKASQILAQNKKKYG